MDCLTRFIYLFYLLLCHPPVEGSGGCEVGGEPGTVHPEEMVRAPQDPVAVSQQGPGEDLGSVDTGSSPGEGHNHQLFGGSRDLQAAVLGLDAQAYGTGRQHHVRRKKTLPVT